MIHYTSYKLIKN